MNQIYLGNRAYGFAAASEAYFGKPLKSVSIAEAAMLAGLPKAPSAYNPISNPKRARSRQLYIIERMQEIGYITADEAAEAKADVFITADFKYHQFFDADNKIVVVDVGHYESEQYTKELIHNLLKRKFSIFALRLSDINTNPVNYL